MDPETLATLLARTKNIRNVCVVSHVGQGKTSFVKDILAKAREGGGNRRGGGKPDDEDGLSIYNDDGGDSEDDEDGGAGKKEKNKEKKEEETDRSTCTSIRYEMKEEDMGHVTDCDKDSRDFYITLIDPSGHVDNNSEVTSAIRVTDGCIIIADCVRGIGSTTEAVMHMAFAEHTRPVLLINRLDLSIQNLELEPEQMYRTLEKCVWTYNKIVDGYGKPMYKVDPGNGSVAFGSGLQGWAFTLHEFARMYTAKFNIDLGEMKQKLWGDNFFNPREKKWGTTQEYRSSRGFVQFVLSPLYKVINVCMYKGRQEIIEFAEAMEFPLSDSEKLMKRDTFLKLILDKWLPAGRTLLNMIVTHLPSPLTVQSHKTEHLYDGELSGDIAKGMKTCNPEAGVVMYVSRLVPAKDKDRLYAFGRIFSGTVHRQQRVQVTGSPQFDGNKTNVQEDAIIESVGVIYDGEPIALERVPCGVICGVLGVDTHIVKSATLSTMTLSKPLRSMKYKVECVVGMSIEPKEAGDLPTVMESLKHIERVDIRVKVEMTKTGALSVWGVNEAHVTRCIEQLKERLGSVAIKTHGPVLPYRETVTSRTPELINVRSEKGNNSITMEAESLPKSLVRDVVKGMVTPLQDMMERAVYLEKKHKINLTYGKKLWCFGPDGNGPNLMFDCIKGRKSQHLQEVEPAIMAGFQWVTQKGALCEEAMRGVRYNLHVLQTDEDADQRSTKDILPVVLRVLNAAALSGKPRLMQPVYKTEIQCPESVSPDVFEVIISRHGLVTKERSVKDWDTYYIEAHLPVVNAMGFEQELRQKSKGEAAMTQCVFDHWENLPGSPLDPYSKTARIIRDIRTRKGLSEEIPTVETFL